MRLPTGGFTITVLNEPSSSGAVTTLLQFTVLTPLVFTCSTNPAEGDGQETAMVFVDVRAMESSGEPGGCTAAIKPQKPPSTD